MTAEQAIEIITNAIQTEHMTAMQDKALAMAQKALEKQIPKKPDVYGSCYCPSCFKSYEEEYNFCPYCGQTLDWEAEE